MNQHVEPRMIMETAIQAPAAALVTASYAPDFERCRLLCETIDARVSGMAHHYLLVAHHDVALFKQLEGPRRTVVDERDLLPRWLHSLCDPTSFFRKRIWLSTKTQPLRGWHVQQMRRIALAEVISEPALVFVDSDVAFVRDFDCRAIWQGDRVPLFRRDNGLKANLPDHLEWSRNAALAFGITPAVASPHDYVTTLVTWRRDSTRDMCRRIEAEHGRHWIEVLGKQRKFSECTLYGRYVDEIEGLEHHYLTDRELCHVYWGGPSLSQNGLDAFVAQMMPYQVAIGIQSFVGTDIEQIRRTLA